MARSKHQPYLQANYLTGGVDLITKWSEAVADDGSKRKNVEEKIDITDEFNAIVHDREHQRLRARRTKDGQ